MYVSTVHYSAVKCPWCLWNLHALVKHPCVVLTHQHLHYQPLNLLQEPLEGPASKFVEIDLFPWKSPLRSCTFSEFSNFGCVACCADWLTFHPVYLCHLTDNSGKACKNSPQLCVSLASFLCQSGCILQSAVSLLRFTCHNIGRLLYLMYSDAWTVKMQTTIVLKAPFSYIKKFL